ncbi:hypothetical protein A2U01_0071365, partial [Trifolium medium]|nr:hypothetical protein [Trifolium medium]
DQTPNKLVKETLIPVQGSPSYKLKMFLFSEEAHD